MYSQTFEQRPPIGETLEYGLYHKTSDLKLFEGHFVYLINKKLSKYGLY